MHYHLFTFIDALPSTSPSFKLYNAIYLFISLQIVVNSRLNVFTLHQLNIDEYHELQDLECLLGTLDVGYYHPKHRIMMYDNDTSEDPFCQTSYSESKLTTRTDRLQQDRIDVADGLNVLKGLESEEKESPDCSICFRTHGKANTEDTFKEYAIIPNCPHSFCKSCIEQWLKQFTEKRWWGRLINYFILDMNTLVSSKFD